MQQLENLAHRCFELQCAGLHFATTPEKGECSHIISKMHTWIWKYCFMAHFFIKMKTTWKTMSLYTSITV